MNPVHEVSTTAATKFFFEVIEKGYNEALSWYICMTLEEQQDRLAYSPANLGPSEILVAIREFGHWWNTNKLRLAHVLVDHWPDACITNYRDGYPGRQIEKPMVKIETDQHTFWAYTVGSCAASVCTQLPIDEATERLNKEHPTGVGPWRIADEFFRTGESNPCVCSKMPETHKHFLFHC